MNGRFHAQATLLLEKGPLVPIWIVGSVDPRVSFDVVRKRNLFLYQESNLACPIVHPIVFSLY
jgi:hypothetical protein